MRGLLHAAGLAALLAGCSSEPSSFDGNMAGGAAATLDDQANMLEDRANEMIAAAEAATVNAAEAGNAADAGGPMAGPPAAGN